MKLELTVDGNMLENLFRPNGQHDKLTIARRLSSNTLVVSNQLLKFWETDIRESGLSELFESWLFEVMSSSEQFRKVTLTCDIDDTSMNDEKEAALINTARQTEKKIVVGDIDQQTINRNKNMKFINSKIMASDKKQIVNLSMVKEYFEDSIPIKRYLFDLYEVPVSVEVESNSSSTDLAKYLAEFYDSTMIIQDLYLPRTKQNEENFSQYILPYVDKEACNITLIMSTENGNRKSEFEKKYSVNVKCIPPYKDKLHQGFIKTTKFKITLPYRLLVFGEKGKNNSDLITIAKYK